MEVEMKMKRIIQSFLISFFCMIILLSNGCSLMGLGIGALVDSNHPKTIPGMPLLYHQYHSFQPGTRIEILTKDSAIVQGKYTGVKDTNLEEYDRIYSRNLDSISNEPRLPAIGDSIVVYSWAGKKDIECVFFGFDYESILLKFPDRPEKTKVNLYTIRDITDQFGNDIQSNILRKMVAEGEIPILSGISVEQEAGEVLVRIDDIDQIRFRTSSGKIMGFLVGGIIDVIVLIKIHQRAESWSDFSIGDED